MYQTSTLFIKLALAQVIVKHERHNATQILTKPRDLIHSHTSIRTRENKNQ